MILAVLALTMVACCNQKQAECNTSDSTATDTVMVVDTVKVE